MVPPEVLLSMDGGMELHSCIEQVDFESGHSMPLLWYDDYECMLYYEYEHGLYLWLLNELYLVWVGVWDFTYALHK